LRRRDRVGGAQKRNKKKRGLRARKKIGAELKKGEVGMKRVEQTKGLLVL